MVKSFQSVRFCLLVFAVAESDTNQFVSCSSTMAIVEDDVRNESEEENEIEVVVEDFQGDEQDSDSESEVRKVFVILFLLMTILLNLG